MPGEVKLKSQVLSPSYRRLRVIESAGKRCTEAFVIHRKGLPLHLFGGKFILYMRPRALGHLFAFALGQDKRLGDRIGQRRGHDVGVCRSTPNIRSIDTIGNP